MRERRYVLISREQRNWLAQVVYPGWGVYATPIVKAYDDAPGDLSDWPEGMPKPPPYPADDENDDA